MRIKITLFLLIFFQVIGNSQCLEMKLLLSDTILNLTHFYGPVILSEDALTIEETLSNATYSRFLVHDLESGNRFYEIDEGDFNFAQFKNKILIKRDSALILFTISSDSIKKDVVYGGGMGRVVHSDLSEKFIYYSTKPLNSFDFEESYVFRYSIDDKITIKISNEKYFVRNLDYCNGFVLWLDHGDGAYTYEESTQELVFYPFSELIVRTHFLDDKVIKSDQEAIYLHSMDGEDQLISISDSVQLIFTPHYHNNINNEKQLMFYQDSMLYLHDLSTQQNILLNDAPLDYSAFHSRRFGMEDNHVYWLSIENPGGVQFSWDGKIKLYHYDVELESTEIIFETEVGDSTFFESMDFNGDSLALLVRKHTDEGLTKIFEVYLYDFSCPNVVEEIIALNSAFSLVNNLCNDLLEVEVYDPVVELYLVDQSGRKLSTYLLQSGVNQIDLTGLPSQVYFLMSEKAGVEKFVKM